MITEFNIVAGWAGVYHERAAYTLSTRFENRDQGVSIPLARDICWGESKHAAKNRYPFRFRLCLDCQPVNASSIDFCSLVCPINAF